MVAPPSFRRRYFEVRDTAEHWSALMRLWDAVFQASQAFMVDRGSLLVDLPITTRMISSPGALTGTIPSDVDPFAISFFELQTFLTQSSQLYLEFAITNPDVQSAYCWEKSFRREPADFRHLPEFTHIEWEGNVPFEDNLACQQSYLVSLVHFLLNRYSRELSIFLDEASLDGLRAITEECSIPRVTFHEAFRLLRVRTGEVKYDVPAIKNFGVLEEILLTEIIGGPVFVTHFIGDEVAFYHAPDPRQSELVVNADLLYPGYGELIGSGERIHSREETRRKAEHFRLNLDDYQPYIDSRDPRNSVIHSGWGMGIERFLHAVLQLPFIWETKPFPRVHDQHQP